MAGQNIKITIESEESYWIDLMDALRKAYPHSNFTTSDPGMSRRIAAVTHFLTKLNNALAAQANGIVTSPDQLTKEDMTTAYHDSFTV